MAAIPELTSRQLLCHCKAGSPCHGDALCRLYKKPPSEEAVLWVAWQVYVDNLDRSKSRIVRAVRQETLSLLIETAKSLSQATQVVGHSKLRRLRIEYRKF